MQEGFAITAACPKLVLQHSRCEAQHEGCIHMDVLPVSNLRLPDIMPGAKSQSGCACCILSHLCRTSRNCVHNGFTANAKGSAPNLSSLCKARLAQMLSKESIVSYPLSVRVVCGDYDEVGG